MPGVDPPPRCCLGLGVSAQRDAARAAAEHFRLPGEPVLHPGSTRIGDGSLDVALRAVGPGGCWCLSPDWQRVRSGARGEHDHDVNRSDADLIFRLAGDRKGKLTKR